MPHGHAAGGSGAWIAIVTMAVAVIVGGISDIMLKAGMDRMGPISEESAVHGGRTIWHALHVWQLWLGVTLQIAYFSLFAFALSQAPLSFVVPFTAGTFVFVVLSARYYLHEEVPFWRWVGAAIIVVGLYLVGRSS